MLAALVGILMIGGSGWLLWALLPREGVLNRYATMPVLESLLPLAIVGGFAVGLSLILLAH